MSNKITDALSAMRERLKAATDAPWFLRGLEVSHDYDSFATDMGHDCTSVVATTYDECDADFIAHAPTDLAKLIEACSVLNAALTWYGDYWGTNSQEIKTKGYSVEREAQAKAAEVLGRE